jgi:lipopolysaccharide transport system permease protein
MAMIGSIWRHRTLIIQMSKREVMGRYVGSIMGLQWSILHPMLMLAVYTFVFSVIFKARWGIPGESKTQFALVLFAGLIVHGLFAEVLNRSPGLIIANINYVKKVVFPLEILPVIALGTALFHGFVSVCVLLVAFVLMNGFVHWTFVFLPLVLLPLMILTLGLAWFLASLGVFVRDIGQSIGILTMILLFMSPVFFPVSALPEAIRPWMMLNPLTFIIEQARQVLVWGQQPSWLGLLAYGAGALVVAWGGFFWFQKTRKGFADVV